ncbi:class I SAM-dependent methyltransferase [Verrucomicrobiota bacterium]
MSTQRKPEPAPPSAPPCTGGESDGVLDRTYARDRATKPVLRFRLAVRARVVADAIGRHPPGGGRLRVLDMGCAEGRTAAEICRLLPGSSVDGIEYSRELVDAAAGLPDSVTVRLGDITALPDDVAAESYEVVSALAVLEHLPSPVLAAREAWKALKPGGLFVATSPSPCWSRLAGKLRLLNDEAHVLSVDKAALLRVVKEAGLEPLEYRRFMWAPVAFLPYLRILPCAAAALRIDRMVEALWILNWTFVNQAIIARKPV